jgi:hypothetical protein
MVKTQYSSIDAMSGGGTLIKIYLLHKTPDKSTVLQFQTNVAKQERERLAQQALEKQELERLARQGLERQERERLAQEAREAQERERLAREAHEAQERERLAREGLEKQERERLAREAHEARQAQERLARQGLERERLSREAQEARQAQERERLAREAQEARQAQEQQDAREIVPIVSIVPKIQIDEYIFELKLYNKDAIHGRGCLQIVSYKNGEIDDKNTFYYYQSKSELGFWRLCIYAAYGLQLSKGGDYVQSTFVHLSLQEFINKNIHIVPTNSDIDCEYADNISTQIDCAIDNGYNPIFVVSPDKCDSVVMDKDLKFKTRMVDKPIFNKIVKCGSRIWNDFSDRIQFDAFSDVLKDTYPNLKNNELFMKSYNQTIHAGQYYKNFSNHDDGTTHSYVNLCGDIYRIEMHNNDSTDILVLYYIKYNIVAYLQPTDETRVFIKPDGKPFLNKQNRFAPIFLTIPEHKINKYGIYTKFVKANSYICKILDYTLQSNQYETATYPISIAPGPAYAYIGTRYNMTYPYTELAKLTQPLVEPKCYDSISGGYINENKNFIYKYTKYLNKKNQLMTILNMK